MIIGSASKDSSNSKLIDEFTKLSRSEFQVTTVDDLSVLPHFDPSLTERLPGVVSEVLNRIETADGIVICSPEYIFSIPARLKNLMEWCVATTVFLNKPVGLITASADGRQGHAQLKLIINTLGAVTTEDAELIISGIKGKFNEKGECEDLELLARLNKFEEGLKTLLANK